MVLSLKRWKSRSPPGIEASTHKEPITISKTPGAGWSSPVARQAHNLKVTGSNPVPATNPEFPKRPGKSLGAFFMSVANALRRISVSRDAPARAPETRHVDLLLGVQVGVSGCAKGVAPPWLSRNSTKYATRRDRDYKLSDGSGLCALIRPNRTKLWRMKYRFDGREKMLSFGTYPSISLADGHVRRTRARALLDDGRDPGAGRMRRHRR